MYKGTIQALIRGQAFEKTIIKRLQKYKTEVNTIKQSNIYPSQLNKGMKSQPFILYLKAKRIQNAQSVHKNAKKITKKQILAQNKTQTEAQLDHFSMQQQTLNSKIQKDQRQLKKIKSDSSNSRFNILQKKKRRLTEILGLQKKVEKMSQSNIRQNQSNQQKKQDNFINLALQRQKNSFNSLVSVSAISNQSKSKEILFQNMSFNNVKMTFKQLIKARKSYSFQQNTTKCQESLLLKRKQVIPQQIQKQRNRQPNKTKERLFFEQQIKKIAEATKSRFKNKSKIKSHIKQTQEILESFSQVVSSMVAIKQSNIAKKNNNFMRKLTNNRSSYKSNLFDSKRIIFRSKSVMLKPRILQMSKTQQALSMPKQVNGWEHTNDFFERQSICELLQSKN